MVKIESPRHGVVEDVNRDTESGDGSLAILVANTGKETHTFGD